MNKHNLPIHGKVIAYDETEYWNLESCPHREWIERVEGVYLFDANVHTYCCSFSPSYWMIEIENRAVFKEGFWNQPDADAMVDAVDNWMRSGPRDDGSCYMNVGDVDIAFERLLQEPFRASDLGETDWITQGGYAGCSDEELEVAYEEQMQALEEDVRCNTVI